jgi:hypothetical protein
MKLPLAKEHVMEEQREEEKREYGDNSVATFWYLVAVFLGFTNIIGAAFGGYSMLTVGILGSITMGFVALAIICAENTIIQKVIFGGMAIALCVGLFWVANLPGATP